ncbi:Ger(x)C family spore germination protein [Effusibacillus lacus]|uniref:Spore gernimation protein GerC n=1 Tax=Effusibacillus lacus TaxID=1348429 RepID=A0A292YJU8_9BACL|nr:Ger(x)C family spore germination protein [Effusibacillus lacus]TCS76099.1 spore germination protein KC [Effusibacillus lacus]GAX91387.1 spore gernimation protein GerC [Effusibacillus lacus]
MNAPFFRKTARTLLFFSLCTVVLPLAGCWDRREINDVLVVGGAGIDKKEDKIELSVQMVIPRTMDGGQTMGGSGGKRGGGEQPTVVRSATGVTIADAMAKLQEKIPRKIFWGQQKILVIGEGLAKEGIREEIDFITRHPEPRLRILVFVSKGKAADILEILPPLEQFSVEQIRELAKLRFGLEVTTKDLLQMLRGEAGAAVLPWIEEEPPRQDGEKNKTTIRLNGSAVIKKDKMIGYINDEITRGVLWLRNEIRQTMVTIEPKEAEGRVSLEMLRANVELLPKIENGKWKMTVKVVTEDDVVQNGTPLNMMNPTVIKILEKEAAYDLEYRIRMTLDEVQKGMKADVFGFGEAFHRKYPEQWATVKDRWDKVFPKVDVQLHAKVYIRRPGLSTVPPAVPEKEVKKKEKEIKKKEKEGKEE